MDQESIYKEWESLYIGGNEELYPLFSGYQCCAPLHKSENIRDYYLLCCVQSGYGTFYNGSLKDYKENDEYRMGPGETFLITPGRLVSYKADEYEPWTYAWIAFSGRNAGKYLQSTDFHNKPVAVTGTKMYDRLYELTKTTGTMENDTLRYMYASAVLWTIMADMIHDAKQQDCSYRMNNYVETAVSIIRRRYDKNLNVSDIASALGISREYFYTLFKNDMGKSPSRYLLDFRIEKACAMLHESDYPVYLIAQHTGFSDKAYFSRKFHELVGMSPAAYRKYSREFSNDNGERIAVGQGKNT